MAHKDIEWLLREKYQGEKSDAFFADCKQLALGVPLAYIIGWSPFLDCKIYLDKQPLIPRPETEFWVEQAIATIKNSQPPSLGFTAKANRVLDLCAGSGCVGVAIAKAIPASHVDFSEIDARLIPTIAKNLTENSITEQRYTLYHTSLFNNLTEQYDYIFSNPPYIDEQLNRTEVAVKEHEPYVALFGGKNGMEIIEQIIIQAPTHLARGGQLWIEHEPEQSEIITTLAQENNFSCTNHLDQYQVERYSILVLQ